MQYRLKVIGYIFLLVSSCSGQQQYPPKPEEFDFTGIDEAIKDSIKYWSSQINLDPKNSHSYYMRAVFLNKSFGQNYAITDLKKAIELDPNFIEPHKELGISLYGIKKYPDSIKEFNYYSEKKHSDEECFFYLGMIYHDIGYISLSDSLLKKCLESEKYKNDGDVTFTETLNSLLLKNNDSFYKNLRAAIQIDPSYSIKIFGEILDSLKIQGKENITGLKRYFEKNQKDCGFILALIYMIQPAYASKQRNLKNEDFDQTLHFLSGCKFNKEIADVVNLYLGLVYKGKGDFKKALGYFQTTNKLNSKLEIVTQPYIEQCECKIKYGDRCEF